MGKKAKKAAKKGGKNNNCIVIQNGYSGRLHNLPWSLLSCSHLVWGGAVNYCPLCGKRVRGHNGNGEA